MSMFIESGFAKIDAKFQDIILLLDPIACRLMSSADQFRGYAEPIHKLLRQLLKPARLHGQQEVEEVVCNAHQ